MTSSTWGQLVSSMPDEPNTTAPASPLRNYELLVLALHAIVQALESKPSEGEVISLLETGLDCLMLTCEAQGCTLFVLDEHSRELHFVVVKGSVPEEKLKWRTLAPGSGIAGWVAEHAEHVVSNDIDYDSRFCDGFDQELGYKTRTVVAVPIMHDSCVLGVVELLNKAGKGLFTTADAATASVFANLAGQVLSDLTSRGQKTTA